MNTGLLTAAIGGGAIIPVQGNTMVLFGDSVTLANDTSPNDLGYFNWYNAIAGRKFNVTYNAGVGGNSTTQMLARVQSDVVAKGAAWCCVMGGVNDVVAGIPSATTIANLQAIYRALHLAKMNVIAVTCTPSTSIDTEGKGDAWRAVNQAIRDFAAANRWLHLADAGAEYLDTSQPTLAVPLTGYTTDGRHPNALGAGTIGKKMASDMASDATVAAVTAYGQLVTVADDPSIWVNSVWGHQYNALMSGTAGAKSAPATGTVATEWVVSGGGAWSKVARTDGKPGAWQQVVLNSDAQATLTAYDTTNPVPGDTLWAECEIETDETWTSIKGIPLTLTFLQTSTVLGKTEALGYSSGGGSGTACVNPRTAVLRTPNMVVPAGCNKLRITLAIYANTAGSATIRVSRMCIRKAL